jgi:hypothetical protein
MTAAAECDRQPLFELNEEPLKAIPAPAVSLKVRLASALFLDYSLSIALANVHLLSAATVPNRVKASVTVQLWRIIKVEHPFSSATPARSSRENQAAETSPACDDRPSQRICRTFGTLQVPSPNDHTAAECDATSADAACAATDQRKLLGG